MKIKLGYGRGFVTLKIPGENVAKVVEPKDIKGSSAAKAFEEALQNPIGERLEDMADGKRVCLLIEDSTRSTPLDELIGALIPRLKKAREVITIITTGTHDPVTSGNFRIADTVGSECKKHGLKKFEILINDCKNSEFIFLGNTSQGTPVHANKEALGFDLYVATSNLKPHYFAGYSNPTKNFVPGVTSFETTERNHSFTMDARSTFGVHPLHPHRKDNPLAADILDAMRMITKDAKIFTLCFVKSGNKILWSKSGDLKKVVGEGFEKVDETSNYKVEPSRYVIVSPGRFPNDESLYISQRALELTKNAIADNAEVLFLSKCENRIAPNEKGVEHFYNRLKDPIDEILAQDRSEYKLYSHKAYRFALLLKRIRRLWVYSSLEDKIIADIHMSPVKSPQDVVDGWLRDDPKAKISVFNNANRLAI